MSKNIKHKNVYLITTISGWASHGGGRSSMQDNDGCGTSSFFLGRSFAGPRPLTSLSNFWPLAAARYFLYTVHIYQEEIYVRPGDGGPCVAEIIPSSYFGKIHERSFVLSKPFLVSDGLILAVCLGEFVQTLCRATILKEQVNAKHFSRSLETLSLIL